MKFFTLAWCLGDPQMTSTQYFIFYPPKSLLLFQFLRYYDFILSLSPFLPSGMKSFMDAPCRHSAQSDRKDCRQHVDSYGISYYFCDKIQQIFTSYALPKDSLQLLYYFDGKTLKMLLKFQAQFLDQMIKLIYFKPNFFKRTCFYIIKIFNFNHSQKSESKDCRWHGGSYGISYHF